MNNIDFPGGTKEQKLAKYLTRTVDLNKTWTFSNLNENLILLVNDYLEPLFVFIC